MMIFREPVRIRWEKRDGEKVRVSKRSGEVIPKPDVWKAPYPVSKYMIDTI